MRYICESCRQKWRFDAMKDVVIKELTVAMRCEGCGQTAKYEAVLEKEHKLGDFV